ncbi:MAG TPA: hypothetical protein VH391_00580 [Solirubrobacterales bacterium]
MARSTRRGAGWLVVLLAIAAGAIAASPATASKMRSTKLDKHLCKTVHGGKFVPIPGFPGEKIDRRLIPDIRWMKHRFDIFITDGYSSDPVHATNGEHPIGLATDIVPNRAKGGNWRKIGHLAHLAEPRQNAPIAPWRWVGWNGDAGHGRGNHLHLSWMHSPTRPHHPARVVYTRSCPAPVGSAPARHRHRRRSAGPTGGTRPSGHGGFGPNGGVPSNAKLAPAVRDF